MPKKYCDYCNKSDDQIRLASPRKRRAATKKRRPHEENTPFGLVIIHSAAKGKVNYAQLCSETTRVHIHGFLFRFMVEDMVRLCPDLEVIQLPPKMLERVSPNTRDLCTENGISLETGIINFDTSNRWKANPVCSPDYLDNLQFMRELSPSQKAKFAELIDLGFVEAKMTARYFCLNGEDPCSLIELTNEFGFQTSGQHGVSAYIRAVLSYLGHDIELNTRSKQKLGTIRRKVVKLRAERKEERMVEGFCRETGLGSLPVDFPLSRLDVLDVILMAKKKQSNRIRQFRKKFRRKYDMVMFRFGLSDGIYHSMQATGDKFGCSREWVRLAELDFLEALGIQEE